MSHSSSAFDVAVDHYAFGQTKRAMNSTFLNVTQFEASFIDETSANHLQPIHVQNTANLPTLLGPAEALVAHYNNDFDVMMAANDIIERATTVKQRFFSEVLLAEWSDLGRASGDTTIPSVVTTTNFRLIVTPWIGIVTCVLFFCFFALATWLLYLTRLARRPLGLQADPSTIATAALAIQDVNTAACFQDMDRASIQQIKSTLSHYKFLIVDGKLLRADNTVPVP